MKKTAITYIVPDYDGFGGIQTLAKNTSQILKPSKYYAIKEYGWYFKEIPLFIRGAFRYAPYHVGGLINRVIIKPHFIKQTVPKADLYHYWCVDASLPYRREPYILSAYGRELLHYNVTGFRKRAYVDALNGAALIHVCSKYTKQLIRRNFPSVNPNKIVVINPYVPPVSIPTRSARPEGAQYIVGTLTRLIGRKNVSNVIRALVILKEVYKLDLVYYLAGDGPEQGKTIRELKRAGIAYKYFGKIKDKEKIDEFYPALDVFVLPPLETHKDVEGFGIVFLEANASGVPVVASDTGGVSDAVKPGVSGYFADPASPGDIADKIHMILTNGQDWHRSAYDWTKNFNRDKTANAFERLYKQALRRSVSPIDKDTGV